MKFALIFISFLSAQETAFLGNAASNADNGAFLSERTLAKWQLMAVHATLLLRHKQAEAILSVGSVMRREGEGRSFSGAGVLGRDHGLAEDTREVVVNLDCILVRRLVLEIRSLGVALGVVLAGLSNCIESIGAQDVEDSLTDNDDRDVVHRRPEVGDLEEVSSEKRPDSHASAER